MITKELKDWSFDELVTAASWKVMDSILKGSLLEGVHNAITLALRWKAEQKEADNG